MKKVLLQILPLFILLLAFSACQKGEDVALDNFRTQPTAQEYLDKYVDQKIVFQYGELTEKGEINQGWVIDKNGKIMGFEFGEAAWETEEENCSLDDMAKLESMATEELGSVDLEELVKHYKLITGASMSSPEMEHQTGESANAFFAYRLRNQNAANQSIAHTCDDDDERGYDDFSSPYYDQVLLYKKGKQNIVNQSNQAHEIMDWLDQVQLELGR